MPSKDLQSGNPPTEKPSLIWKQRAFYLCVFIVFLVCTFFAYLIEVYYHIEEPPTFSTIPLLKLILEEVAIASAIALFLAFTIEKFTAERFADETKDAIERIKENVLEAVYGKHIPSFLFDEMDDFFKAYFVRHQYRVTYSLERLEHDHQTYIKEIVRIMYTVENLTYGLQSYPLSLSIELPESPGLRPECKFIRMRIDGKDSRNLAPRPDAESNGYRSYTGTEKGASAAAPSNLKEIEIVFQSIVKASERRAWRSNYPADSFKFTVRSQNGLRARLTPFTKKEPKAEPNLHANEYVWTFYGAIFPHVACFEYWWEDTPIANLSVSENEAKGSHRHQPSG